MSFIIVWSDFAESELDKIFEYYNEKAGNRVAKKIIQEIITEPNILIESPNITQIEDFLLNRENIYRYLKCKNYKIIYTLNEKKKLIQIADVFDTRQNPIKMLRTK